MSILNNCWEKFKLWNVKSEREIKKSTKLKNWSGNKPDIDILLAEYKFDVVICGICGKDLDENYVCADCVAKLEGMNV